MNNLIETFVAEIEAASLDTHDIESAYEEIINHYERQHPEFDWRARFNRIAVEAHAEVCKAVLAKEKYVLFDRTDRTQTIDFELHEYQADSIKAMLRNIPHITVEKVSDLIKAGQQQQGRVNRQK